MIGKEDNEEVILKVTDRRKFNFDGSVKEGVELTKEEPKAEVARAEKPAAPAQEELPPVKFDVDEEIEQVETSDAEDDFPDADNPASFVNFLSTLATNAAAALGAMPHPATGQRTLDLESGKYWIEILSMLRDKTKGNLHPKESELLTGILSDLKMQFVQINRMAEERLKQQAAQKFSGSDILGRK